MIKRKRLDRDIWTTMTRKRYAQKTVHGDDFDGVVALLHIDAVSSPSLWQYPDGPVAVCDGGMKWLEFLPFGGNYALTAVIGADNRINLWYVDIICGSGADPDGTAYFDDLYLDLILRPGGDLKVDDEDELEEAFHRGEISGALYAMAHRVKNELIPQIMDTQRLTGFCMKYLQQFEAME